MRISGHPSVEELRQALREKDVRLACTVCGRTEFSVEEAAILSGGSAQGYGAHRLPRTQVVCENCGHVMSFAVAKLQES